MLGQSGRGFATKRRAPRSSHTCSKFLSATIVKPKTALIAVDVSSRQPRNPLAREAVHPAPTNSTVATAKETLIATKTDAPKHPWPTAPPGG